MKERGISFSGHLPQAAHDGWKTQTRRVIKGIPENANMISYYGAYGRYKERCEGLPQNAPRKVLENSLGWFIPEAGDLWPCNDEDRIRCPYGQPGDRLYIKEEHYAYGHWEKVPGKKTKKGKQKWKFVRDERAPIVFYASPGVYKKSRPKIQPENPCWYKRLARFMPRKYARTWLEITDIRVERLNDISEEDAKAEGIELIPGGYWRNYLKKDGSTFYSSVMSFESLWESINGQGSWDKNDWVWVIGFKKI